MDLKDESGKRVPMAGALKSLVVTRRQISVLHGVDRVNGLDISTGMDAFGVFNASHLRSDMLLASRLCERVRRIVSRDLSIGVLLWLE